MVAWGLSKSQPGAGALLVRKEREHTTDAASNALSLPREGVMLSQHIIQTERQTLQFRLLALLVVVGGLFVLRQEIQPLPAIVLALAYLGYSISLRTLILPKFSGPAVVYAMTLVDSAALAVGSRVLGGMNPLLVVLFPLSVVHYAIYLGYSGSFFAATAMAVSYVGLAAVDGGFLASGGALAGQVILYYLLAAFSGHLGQRGIRESQQVQSLQELLEVEAGAKAILDVALRIQETLDVGHVLDEIAAEVPRITGLPHCIIYLLGESSGRLSGATSTAGPEGLGVRHVQDPPEALQPESLAARALDARKPVVADASRPPSFPWPEWTEQLGLQVLVAVPLFFRDRGIGVMYLGGLHPSPPSAVEMRLAEAIGAVAGVAIGNALAHKKAQEGIERLVNELDAALQTIGALRQERMEIALEIGGLLVDGTKREVVITGERVQVSPTEFDVLWLLAQNANHVVTYDSILSGVWGISDDSLRNRVNVCVHRLREKIEDDPSTATRIRAVRGVGYMLCGESENRRS